MFSEHKNNQDTTIQDRGILRGIQNLSEDKIASVIQPILKTESGSRTKSYLSACVHCGMCSHACHFCVSHDLDPQFSPAGKTKQTIWEMVVNKGRVSPEFIGRCAQIAFTQCNLCKRCAMYCPLGIDTSYLMKMVRKICYRLKVLPEYLHDTAHSHAVTLNQMWVKDDEWIDTVQWQEEELRDEFPAARIPLEKEGADIMYSVIAPEPKFQPQLIYQTAAIMNMAGVSWTLPASKGWDNSDMAMYLTDNAIMARVKRQHFETALRLKVKKIVMCECGHAFRSIYDVGNRELGWRMYPIPVQHAIHFYWDLLMQDSIRVGEKFTSPVTIHDPCNIVRGRGLHEMLRDIVYDFCTDVREMQPNREHNFCCAAGGGVINCGPGFKESRIRGNKVKADQLRETGAEVVIAPCHNCHSGLEDIIKFYELGMKVKFLGDIIYECMQKE